MKCRDCKYWQGTKYSEWGDCNRVVAHLEPLLLDCYQTNEYGTIERFFTVPFDPHDAKYWSGNSSWRTLYTEILINPLSTHRLVRVVEETKDDIIFDNQNGERIGKLKVKYFQTNTEYECNANG
jgi:hypothetical protein